MHKHFLSLLLGYLIGTISPAALVSKVKKQNLKEANTGNLGATNTMLTFGWTSGVFVMVVDMLKSFLIYHIAMLLFPDTPLAGLLAGIGAVVGHIFPFYLHFKGGKGSACFAGLVLAMDPILFPILLTIGIILAILIDYVLAVPISAVALFPFLIWYRTGSLTIFLLCAAMDLLIFCKHIPNFTRIRTGEEKSLREYFRSKRENA